MVFRNDNYKKNVDLFLFKYSVLYITKELMIWCTSKIWPENDATCGAKLNSDFIGWFIVGAIRHGYQT